MLDKYYIDIKDHTDLNIYRFGIEDCMSDYSWGPALRDHYIIHYVFKGKGEFVIQNEKYEVSENEGFLIPPGIVVSYKADHDNPWSYCWVGFNGLKADYYVTRLGLSTSNPIFVCEPNNNLLLIIKNMLQAKDSKKLKDLKLLADLYSFLYEINDKTNSSDIVQEPQSNKEEYLKASIEFIAKNYSMPISISEIATHIGIDRSYLFILFKEFLNTSPSEYLINFRISKAKELLKDNTLSVGSVSRSVGYNDQLVFSKTFKKVTGLSPLNYRLKILK